MEMKSIGTNYSMCVQPTFIIGTYNENGTADFAPITWVSATCEKDNKFLLVISMYGSKQTKQNMFRTGQLSVNLVSVDMLELVDYFGSTSGKTNVKDAITYSYSKSNYVNAPILDTSRWIYECEIVNNVKTGESDTFFCEIKNILIDKKIEIGDTFGINLVDFNPVVYSGQYHSIGENLGKIGDYYKNK